MVGDAPGNSAGNDRMITHGHSNARTSPQIELMATARPEDSGEAGDLEQVPADGAEVVRHPGQPLRSIFYSLESVGSLRW